MLIELQNNSISTTQLLSDKGCCDLCSFPQDLIDMAPAPDGNGRYCTGCLYNGDVESYLRRKGTMQPEEVTLYMQKHRI